MNEEDRKKKEQEEFDKLFNDLFKTKEDKQEKKDDILEDDFLKSLFDDDNKPQEVKIDPVKEENKAEKKEDDNFDWLKELIDEIDKEEQEKKKQQEKTTAVVPSTPAKPGKPSFTSKLKDKPRAPKPPEHIRMWGSGKKVVHMPERDDSSKVHIKQTGGKIKYGLISLTLMIFSGVLGYFTTQYMSYDTQTDICRNTNIILKEAYTGDKILIDTSFVSESGKKIIEQGYIDAHISNLIYNLVKQGEKVIDVGAGFGYHTMYLARIVGSSGRVYSFEARKCIAELLENSIKINNFQNVTVFNSVLFSENMKIIIDINDYKKRSSFGVNNIILQQDNVYTDTHREIVNATTLDTVLGNINNISMLNINAHGNELSIILGAKNIIANSPNLKIITTWSKYEMAKYLNVQTVVQQLISNGFRFWLIKPSSGKLVELTRIEHIMQVERGRFLIARSIQ